MICCWPPEGCAAHRGEVALRADVPVRSVGDREKSMSNSPRNLRLARCPGTQGHRLSRDRRRRGANTRSGGWRGSGRLAPIDLPCPIRLAGYGLARPRTPSSARTWRGREGGRHGREAGSGLAMRCSVSARYLRLTHAPPGQACAQAGEPHLRAGGPRHLRRDCPASPTQPRTGRAGAGSAGRRRLWRRGDLRSANSQGVRCTR